jgi:hypothetical protein
LALRALCGPLAKIPSRRTPNIIQGFRDYANSSCDESNGGPSEDSSPHNGFRTPSPAKKELQNQLSPISFVKIHKEIEK